MIPSTTTELARPQTEDDLMGDDLKQYEADIEATNLILISIQNDIYNYVDACQSVQDMWDKVKRLMHGTELSKIKRESRFINEFDQFAAEAGESLCLLNGTNMLQMFVWQKISKTIHMTSYLIIFNNMKSWLLLLEKKGQQRHMTFALVANTHTSSSSSRSPPAYYVTHPPSMVDYDDDYQGDALSDD
ncbi:hypothetical protein Tco_0949982 [Tanacetum coccineum]